MATLLPVASSAMAQSTPSQRTPRAATLAVYLSDFRTASHLGSAASELRARDVSDALAALTYARRGLSFDGTFEPSSEFERDQQTGIGSWDVDVEVELSAEYAYDRERILRAEIAFERAVARWRAQRRSDVERALLALSGARLSSSAVAEAQVDVATTSAELNSAVTAGAAELEIEMLAVEAELAAVTLEQELLESTDAATALAAQGLSELSTPSAAASAAMAAETRVAKLSAPPAPGLTFSEANAPLLAPQLTLLSLRLLVAEQALALTPFETIRELEVYGGYEVGGVEAGARLALAVGVPTTTTTLAWQSGVDDHAFTVGFGATFRLSDRSSAETRVVQREVADARAALADHVSSWQGDELQARRSAELAFREFELELLALELSRDALEQVEPSGDEREVSSARNAVRRAGETGERAWQRYVRALFDYLDVIDVELRFD